jgi:hypothetical protein
MIRTLAVNCPPNLDCSQYAEISVVETDSNEMVMGAVRVLREFSLLVSQQNHSDLSLTAQDDALSRLYNKRGACQDQKMSMSVQANVDKLLARQSHQLWEQKIPEICAAMEVHLYWDEKVTTSKRMEFQVRQNRA